jgi:uncharacterized protein YeaO (DUF488 family)
MHMTDARPNRRVLVTPRLKRTYDPATRSDGQRILVERLWPRGMRKSDLEADVWLKEVAPSTELRRWFGHRPQRWDEFRRRYRKELDAKPDAWVSILDRGQKGTVTLLYSAHDVLHNGALVLRDYLMDQQRRQGASRAGSAASTIPGVRARRTASRSVPH